MANIYSDIAVRPGFSVYPIVNKQTNGVDANNAEGAANFQRILDRLAVEAKAQAQAPSAVQKVNFAHTKASSWAPAYAKAPASTPPTAATAPAEDKPSSFIGFLKNLWDVINPLQHIPVVGAIYRHMTGDTISPAARLVGDTIYGGPVGGGLALADIAYEKVTGKDVGETVIASLTGGQRGKATPSPAATDTMIAQNLTQIAPAAGNATAKNIIWSDNTSQNIIRASRSPLFPPSGTTGEGPASPSPARPAPQANDVASTGVFQTQEAPAGAARKAASPELIASRMMEGLEKYAQMKRHEFSPHELNPQISALY